MKKLWFFWIGLLCAANLFAAIEVVPQAPDRTTDFAVTELRDALDKSVKRLTVDGREINRIVLNFSDRTLGNRFVISASEIGRASCRERV